MVGISPQLTFVLTYWSFLSSWSLPLWCITSVSKFYLSNFLLTHTIHNEPFVCGYYVYAWLDAWQVFYIGMGKNRRAWNEHLPLPENRRRQAAEFRVRILKHNLTKAQAHLAERHYIASHTRRGLVLLNNRIPTTLCKRNINEPHSN